MSRFNQSNLKPITPKDVTFVKGQVDTLRKRAIDALNEAQSLIELAETPEGVQHAASVIGDALLDAAALTVGVKWSEIVEKVYLTDDTQAHVSAKLAAFLTRRASTLVETSMEQGPVAGIFKQLVLDSTARAIHHVTEDAAGYATAKDVAERHGINLDEVIAGDQDATLNLLRKAAEDAGVTLPENLVEGFEGFEGNGGASSEGWTGKLPEGIRAN